ncbi:MULTISPECIES: DUF1127 domain-containing protein [Maritimibacter]|jgi:uncharacterized protein YjiS (DUF1127 family)|nr:MULTISPECIES: DUF1127 domain-containing protein [Maritimibacter]TYP85478.1 uncharacterized protein YjiS (DUF1127 family) [Maritimibacter alkaliphilus HTCC2654]
MSIARRRIGFAPLRRVSILNVLFAMHATRRQRRALGKLDSHLLDDIGVTHKQAWSETNRPFWELPSRHHW